MAGAADGADSPYGPPPETDIPWCIIDLMAAEDGDGWARCDRGHRHWGVYGASGLLAVHHDATGLPHVLMQKRSLWSHHGGTWALPGGALDSHEDSIAGALREARERGRRHRAGRTGRPSLGARPGRHRGPGPARAGHEPGRHGHRAQMAAVTAVNVPRGTLP